MKGIAHFVAGLAAASCFPRAVSAAAEGNPLYMLLGGTFGLLPDTIDFKLIRFLYRHDIEVQPDPLHPDAKTIAAAIAEAVNRAFVSGKPVRIKLNTVHLSADEWQSYSVRFDVPRRRIEVEYGAVVDTSGHQIREAGEDGCCVGHASLLCDIKLEYRATTTVDAFEGPVFEMVPTADGRITPVLVPWHRRWTHGIMMAVWAAVCGALLGDLLAVMIILTTTATHLLLDHAGYMGMSLFFPFRTRRVPGLKLSDSAASLPNAAVVWAGLLIIFWNLYSQAPLAERTWSLGEFFFYGLILPALGLHTWRRIRNKSRTQM
ncbi:MAG: hypothetical protein ACUVWX_05210 [Kiritimatiellia bacterium]